MSVPRYFAQAFLGRKPYVIGGNTPEDVAARVRALNVEIPWRQWVIYDNGDHIGYVDARLQRRFRACLFGRYLATWGVSTTENAMTLRELAEKVLKHTAVGIPPESWVLYDRQLPDDEASEYDIGVFHALIRALPEYRR